ncbi:CUB domain protein, partial [Ostertagia ostertagi]
VKIVLNLVYKVPYLTFGSSVPTLSQFIISFLDRCSGTGDCKHGGYPHPSHCNECLCPNGLSGAKCEDFEPPRKAECGGKITVSEEWQSIESPGFPDPGYDPDQKCNWVFEASAGKRIEFEFIEEFSFLCTSTCVDYVEMKISADLRPTGFRSALLLSIQGTNGWFRSTMEI